ncbi:MAG TPA: hypothetical protein VNZ52_06955 [Candidatus Thermoplasmatota archaeon]|nr:hypothetical protein [Candidatus Thermoplasmatota archaeon]
MTNSAPPPVSSAPQLVKATLAAALVASVVLVVAVLPAEYGVDPTGLGGALGLTQLGGGGSGGGEALVSAPSGRLDTETYSLEAKWALHETTLYAGSAYVTQARTQQTIEIPVNLTNLTRVNATLTWTDDEPGTPPDLFEVSLRAPDGRSSQLVKGDNPPGAPGSLSTFLQWRGVPYPDTGNGTRITFENSPADTSAQGTWRVVVRLYRTGGTPDAPDDGNRFTLKVTAETYSMSLKAKESRVLADTVTLTLAPNGEVEYKFHIEEGDEMEYKWTATGPVYFDFHGDPIPPRGDEFTSYRIATTAGDEGVLKAPFNGRHGWFWWNRGTAPVTITLQTTGDYQVIGVV